MHKLVTSCKWIWGSNTFFFLPLMAISIIGCSFEEPSAPSWDVEVSVPLISKVYTMAEIADDESSIIVDSTGVLNFEVEEALDSYYLDDQLSFENIQENFQQALGIFSVESPGSESSSVDLREIFAQADALDGQTAIVPPFDFESQKKPHDYEGYSYLVVESGELVFQVRNDLEVPLGSPVTIEIWDQAADTLIASSTVQTRINPSSSRNFVLDLSGSTLPSALAIRMTGSSPGSEGDLVTVDADSKFEMSAEITDMQVTEASAEIPSQIVTNEDEVTLDDSFVIVDAKVASGAINLTVNTELPLDTWIIYELPDFLDSNAQVLVDSFLVVPGSPSNREIQLAGYSFQPAMAAFGEQKTQFRWTARTLDTGANQVLVRSSDQFDASFNLNQMEFSEVSGKVANKDIEIDQQPISFDVPADLDSIFFKTARMEVHLNNRINFPANLDVTIEGENEGGAVSFLSVNEAVQPSLQPGVPKKSIIVLDQGNSNIKEFISILPSLIRVQGRVRVGDPNWIGTVTRGDFVNGTVKISAPLALRLPEQEVDTDVNELEIDEDVKQDIIDNLSSGSFYAEISNHIALGASVEFFFGGDSSDVYNTPLLRIGPVAAGGALVDSEGVVRSAEDSEVALELSEEEMRTFLRTPLYAGIRVRTAGTEDEFVQVRGSDFIQIKAYSKVTVKVNQD